MLMSGRSWFPLQRLVKRYFEILPESVSLKTFLIILVFVLVSRLCTFAPVAGARFFIDTIIVRREWSYIPALTGLLLVVGCIQSFASFEVAKLSGIQVQLLLSELRIRIYRHILSLPIPFFDATHSGILYARLIADTEFLRTFVGYQLYDLCGSAITALIALAVLFSISVPMTLIATGAMVLLAFVVRRCLAAISPLWQQQSQQFTALSKEVYEALSGIRILKAYRAESREVEIFSRATCAFAETANAIVRKQSLLSINSTLTNVTLSSVTMMISAALIRQSRLSVGDYVMFTLCLALVTSPVVQFLEMSKSFGEAGTRLANVAKLLDQPTEDHRPAKALKIGRIKNQVRFENVFFNYEGCKDAVTDFSIEMRSGTVTAIVGQSGAGKTTVANLLCAFIFPSQGRILVDGIDITSLDLSTYRAQLGVVLQESFLFDGSIIDNIRFARLEASEVEIATACRIAVVDEFVSQFPNRYETVVGERGVRLSGGQKQRIAIARAILADPSILIFDEATSNLDSVSESAVQAAMNFLVRGRTTLVIAHRLSTVYAADQILVMKSGKIVERGTHETLLAERGEYSRLYFAQANPTPSTPENKDGDCVSLTHN